MFGRNKSSKESSRTRDCSTRGCSGKTNSNVEAGMDMNKKNTKGSSRTNKKQSTKRKASQD